ncbi:MAG: hypothetical protein DDT41_01597 [candidate division WS2 bacterium]|nr:hypothetical protein [Candidatus Psychracetigena formicireducens]
MKRDWIGEILSRGYLIKDISKESGVPQQTLTKYVKGKILFTSKSKHYETIRNVNRKLAARELRDKSRGIKPHEERESIKLADSHKRTYFNPLAEPKIVENIREVKYIKQLGKQQQQLRILGEFRNDKTKQERIQEGWSNVYSIPNYARDLEQAIGDAQYKLGGTNWILVKLLEVGYETHIASIQI